MVNDLEKTTKKGQPVFREERVLVVDDLEKWLGVARDNLRYYRCEEIIEASNPLDAVKKYSEVKPTMAMIDINFDVNNLTDTQGLGLISKIREDDPQIPILAMSSLREDIKVRALASGANYFIDKEKFVEDFDGFIDWYIKMNIY